MNWIEAKTFGKVKPDISDNPVFVPKTWLPLTAIIFMTIAKQIAFAGIVTSYWGASLLEEAWRIAEQILQLHNAGDWMELFRELRALVGVFHLFHLGPFVASFLLTSNIFLAGTLFPTFCLAVSIVLIYQIGQLISNRRVGLLTAFFWGLFPLVSNNMSSNLYNSFYLSAFLLSVTGFLWGQKKKRKLGYGLSVLGSIVCLVGVPILGVFLLILLVGSFSFSLHVNTKKSIGHITWWFWAAGGALPLLLYGFSSPIVHFWNFYQLILSHHEMIILLPLFFGGLVWAVNLRRLDKIAFVLSLMLASAFTYFFGENLQTWPQNREFLSANLVNLDLLLMMLTLTMFTSQSLVQRLEWGKLSWLVIVLAFLVTFFSLLYGIVGSENQFTQNSTYLLNIAASLAVLGVLALPVMLQTPKRLVLTMGLVTLALTYYNVSNFLETETANEQILRGVGYASHTLEAQNIYVCPREFGSRIWYLQNFNMQEWSSASAIENPYVPFLRKIKYNENDVLIQALGCQHNVTDLFDFQNAVMFGEQSDSRILLLKVSGD